MNAHQSGSVVTRQHVPSSLVDQSDQALFPLKSFHEPVSLRVNGLPSSGRYVNWVPFTIEILGFKVKNDLNFS